MLITSSICCNLCSMSASICHMKFDTFVKVKVKVKVNVNLYSVSS